MGPLHRTRDGHVAILTAVDCYTKWFEAWPVKDQTAKTVIKHLTKDYIPRHGVPAAVHSDNGPAFIASIFQSVLRKFDIKATTTPVYNACSNTVERYHRTLNSRLRSLIHELNDDWDTLLPAVLFAMRTTENRTTGYSPFFLTYGREARMPIDLLYGSVALEASSYDAYANRLHKVFENAYKLVALRQNDYVLRQRSLYHEKAKVIQPNDLVWLYTKRPNPALNRKFQSFYTGPYQVIKQVSNTIFEIRSYGKWCVDPVTTTAAVDRLKKCTIRDPETNEGIPVDLKASDVAPYFEEGEEIMGKIPISKFAPHVFGESSLLPFVDAEPEDELPLAADNVTTPRALLPPAIVDNNLQTEDSNVENSPSPPPVIISGDTEVPISEDDSTPPVPPRDPLPPVRTTSQREYETPSVPAPMRPLPKRPLGRPAGAKNKVWSCARCEENGPKCKVHCEACRARQSCPVHGDTGSCRQCTATRRCRRHK